MVPFSLSIPSNSSPTVLSDTSTVLVVTHEKDLVNRFSKRVVAIKDGEMVRDGQGGYYRI